MFKRQDQLSADGYTDFHFFGCRYIWIWIAVTVIFAVLLFLVMKSFQDQQFGQSLLDEFRSETERYRSRGTRTISGLVLVFLFFLTLPLILKLPTTALIGAKLIAKIRWGFGHSLDSHPDVAFGPTGIYYPKNYRFHEAAWDQISDLKCIRTLNYDATRYETSVAFWGQPTSALNAQARIQKPRLLFDIPCRWGMDGEAIIQSVQRHAPHVKVKIIGKGNI